MRADTGRVAERYEYDPYGFVTVLNGEAHADGDKGGPALGQTAAATSPAG